MRRRLAALLGDGPSRATFVVAALLYLAIYLFAIGDVVISREALFVDAPAVAVVDEWPRAMLRARVALLYEPIVALTPSEHAAWLFSPINTLLGALLSIFVGLNVALFVFALRQPRACSVRSAKGVWASLPAFLLGFACCAPTLLIALGSAAASVTLGFIALRAFLYPVALAGTALALWWGLRRVHPELVEA